MPIILRGFQLSAELHMKIMTIWDNEYFFDD